MRLAEELGRLVGRFLADEAVSKGHITPAGHERKH
jgi:hypothetical protein